MAARRTETGSTGAPANAGEREFVITRVFDAPRDLVFKAWTERERLERWWGPKGFSLRVVSLDLRVGGIFHYCMQPAQGPDMWGRFVYREIVAPERLVYVSSFSDERGNVTRPSFSETWPLEVLNTVTFAEQGERTSLTLRSVPIDATDAEHRTFTDMFKSMQHGFKETLDQLDQYLAGAR